MPAGGFWKETVVGGPVVNVQPGRAPMSNDVPGCKRPSEQAALLLAELRSIADKHRIRVAESFKDFDRNRDGTITVPQFTIGLQMSLGKHRPLAEADVGALIDVYAVERSSSQRVTWKVCARITEPIFHSSEHVTVFVTLKVSVDDPTMPKCEVTCDDEKFWTPLLIQNRQYQVFVDDLTRADVSPAAPAPRVLSAADEEGLAKTLSRFRKQITTRRLLPRPFFTDMEKNRRSMNPVDHVTRNQFRQCLSAIGFDVSPLELERIYSKFAGPDELVNYVSFLKAVDPTELYLNRDDKGRAGEVASYGASGGFKAPKVVSAQPGRAPTTSDFPRLIQTSLGSPTFQGAMERLQKKVKQYHMMPSDFFVDYDKHRTGVITLAQVRVGIAMGIGSR